MKKELSPEEKRIRQDRLRAISNNIRGWSFDVIPTIKFDQDEAYLIQEAVDRLLIREQLPQTHR